MVGEAESQFLSVGDQIVTDPCRPMFGALEKFSCTRFSIARECPEVFHLRPVWVVAFFVQGECRGIGCGVAAVHEFVEKRFVETWGIGRFPRWSDSSQIVHLE